MVQKSIGRYIGSRVSEEQYQKLLNIAKRANTSIGEVVRQIIDEAKVLPSDFYERPGRQFRLYRKRDKHPDYRPEVILDKPVDADEWWTNYTADVVDKGETR